MSANNEFRMLPRAAQDLENIYQYSYQEFGGVKAEQYIRGLDFAFNKLATDPQLGIDYSYVKDGLLAYRVVSHVIFFKLGIDGIVIIRILHKSMDHTQHLESVKISEHVVSA